MPLLKSYASKFGKKEAREKYNAYHREYRELHKKKMLAYWKKRRRLQKAKKTELSIAA